MSDLIVVEKAGERISVHPATLDQHQRIGWAVSADQSDTSAAAIAAQSPADGGNDGSGAPISETPDGIPTPIPDDWETMHHTKQISLARALAGDFTAPEGQTMTEKAKSIILAAVTDRANPPAKPA